MIRYWIGNSGDWSSTSHWSTTSGGSGGASVPTSSDDVIFDANSLSANSTIIVLNAIAKSINSNAVTSYNLTFTKDPSATSYMRIYGDATLRNTTSTINVLFRMLANGTYTSVNSNLYSIDIGDTSNSALVNLNSSLTASNIYLNYGRLNTNGYTVSGTTMSIGSSNAYAKTLDITNSIINLLQLFIYINTATTLISSGSTINLSGPNGLIGGGQVYNNVNLLNTGNTSLENSNTYNNLSIIASATLVIRASTTQTINNSFTIGNNASILTDGGGSNYHNLVKSSGTVSVTGNGTIRGSRASGGATWLAASTVTDGGYNTGWNFAPPPPVANFTATPTTGIRPLLVNFTDTSTNAPTSWLWNFGDSTTSTSQNPSKTYSTAGTYSVSLTATSSAGSGSTTKTNYITATIETFIRSISGSLILGGNANRKLLAARSISGTLILGGGARAVILRDVENIQSKRYLYKVYDENGTYIETWGDVASELTYTHEINTIGSTTTVELARNSDTLGVSSSPIQTEAGTNLLTEDNFDILATTESKNQIGSGSSVDYNNRVDIMVFYGSVEPLLTESDEIIMTEDDEDILADIGAPNGNRIFTGFISEINSRFGSTETTLVQLTSYGWDLGQYPLTNVSNQTTVTFSSQDPSTIARTAIDKFVTDSASYDTYTHRDAGSIASTGTTVSYTFRSNTYEDVVNKLLELMPSNWYYRVGLGDNILYYAERSVTPKHLFYLGKHITSLDLKGSILNATNRVLYTGGGDPALYVDTADAPSGRTRRSLDVVSDNRVTVLNSAEVISQGKIDEGNKVQYRTTVEISTTQYDIESIEVGDTVGWRNFGGFIDDLVMQVVGKSYAPDTVQLQLDTKPPTINKRIEDLRRNLIVSENENVPAAPV